MYKDKIDLQLFAEETPVAPSAPAQPTESAPIVTETPVETPKPDFKSMSPKDQGDYLEKQFINLNKKEPVATTTTEPEPVVPPTIEPTPAAVVEPEEQPYTPEEIASTGIDKLDPKRLPAELQPYYKSMLADYTKKTMAVAEQRKQVEQIPVEPPKPKTMDRLRQERMQDIAMVEQILNEGNTGDKIEFNQFDEDHAYVMKRVSDYRVYNENQQNSVKETNERIIQRERSSPDFEAVYEQAKKELVTLAGSSLEGLAMATRILEADERLGQRQASQDDIELLQTFWDNSKTKYKAGKVKPVAPVAPPVKHPVAAETTGISMPTEVKTKRFDPKSAAKMNNTQLANLMGIFAEGGNKK